MANERSFLCSSKYKVLVSHEKLATNVVWREFGAKWREIVVAVSSRLSLARRFSKSAREGLHNFHILLSSIALANA